MTFLVVGEALVDIVVLDSGEQEVRPGGSPLNIAVGLGRLGLDVALLTDIGDDVWGQMVRSHAESSGVRVSGQRAGRTSSATARIAEDGSATYDFDVTGHLDASGHDLSKVAGMHVGSIGAFMEPGASEVRRLFASSGGLRTFDPNIRAALMPSREQSLEIFNAIVNYADVVKMSDEDASWLFPDLYPEEVVEMLVDRGVALVALTLGARGALLRSSVAAVDVERSDGPVVDTIGAGDTFMAALIESALALEASGTSLHDAHRDEVESIGRFASRAAAVTVSRRGADLPWVHEVA